MPALKDQLDIERRRVDVEYSDITIRELLRMLDAKELNAAPVYQRKFRWTEEPESRLIESLFLGLPVPSIFVATNEGYSWEVVDGLQRLSTIMHFVAEPLSLVRRVGKRTPLILAGLEKLTELNGKGFGDLEPALQLYFTRRTFRVTALSDKSDLQIRFDLFDRLNRGSIALTPQEVRACIYRGPLNELIEELADDSNFKKLVKLREAAQNDGTREELVLKFFAYLNDRNRFRGAVTDFLNTYMKDNAETFDVESGRQLFEETVGHLLSATHLRPLLRRNLHVTPANQLEASMVGVAELLRSNRPVRVPEEGWQDDPELVESSTGATNTAAMLRRRIGRAMELFGA